MKKTDWDNLNNSEIEIKLKGLEHEYNSTQILIDKKITLLSSLANDYDKGMKTLNKRTGRGGKWVN